MKERVTLITLVTICLIAGNAAADESGIDVFEKKIRPVLITQCYKCHSGASRSLKGGLRIDSRVGWMRGGDSGAPLIPRKPGESLLIQALRHTGDLQMPPKAKLPDAVINDFVRWVAMGAPDPRVKEPPVGETRNADAEASTTPAPNWAFAPPRTVPAPEVADTAWPRGDLDRFILARLEKAGLHPFGDADRRTLIRRLYFALTGLPPTHEEIAKFVADESPASLENLVDRLLESPQFGERWGRRWLDVARYSDSTGGGRTRALDNAWRYRDYVIASFNADKPFNRFIREQIAGDLIASKDDDVTMRRDSLIATGFLMLGPHNYENQDKELLRMDVVDEQIDTTGRAFLALTLGCARCHDHKFDPIPTRDYYALAGIFRSTKSLTPGNVAGFVQRPLPVNADQQNEIDAHAKEVAALQKQVKLLKARIPSAKKKTTSAARSAASSKQLAGIVIDDLGAKKTGQWMASVHTPRWVDKGYIHDQNQEKGRKSVEFTARLPRSDEYEVRVSYSVGTNRATNTPVIIEHAGGNKTVRINQQRRPPIDGLFLPLGRFRFDAARPARVTVKNDGTDGVVIVDCVQFLPVALADAKPAPTKKKTPREKPQKRAAAPLDAKKQNNIAAAKAKLKKLEDRLKELQGQAPQRSMAISVQEETEPGDWHVHIRGEIRNLGPKVPRGFLTSASFSEPVEIRASESGRRELAEWIAADANPLTARVIVNRVWHWLFGAGLVRTVDNFGHMGEAPSHPELLDTLAVEFQKDGWSIKRLIRRVVLSRTYGLASDPRAGITEVDPENRLLSHAPRRRLEADEMRDTILFVSGDLDRRAGGPAIQSAMGKKTGNKIEYGYQFNTRRRSVYVPIFRNTLLEIFEVFDFADPNLVVGNRTRTTRATQALFLLNSPFMLEQSRRAAERLLGEGEMSVTDRVVRAYERIIGRPPVAAELEAAVTFLRGRGLAETSSNTGNEADDVTSRWAGLVQILFSCVDFRFLR